MKKSLRIKLFRMNILLVTAAVIIFAVYGIVQVRRFATLMEETNREQNAVIMDTMSESMREMATESLQKYVQAQAKVLDGEFWTMRHDLEILARQVQLVLEDPSSYSPVPVAPPAAENEGTVSLQLLYASYADRSDPELTNQILRIGGLRNMILEIVEGSDTLLDCMVSLQGGANIIADRVPATKLSEDGEPLTFDADRRPWYVGAVVHSGFYFTPINRDNYLDIYEVMAGIPVYVDGELAAVCGASVATNALASIVENAELGDNTDTCLINENGNLIYSSKTSGELDIPSNGLKSLKESTNADLAALVNTALKGEIGFSLITIDGEETYVAYAPLDTIGWTQLLMISQEDLNRTAYLLTNQTDSIMEDSIARTHSSAYRMIFGTLVIALFLIALAIATSLLFAGHLVRPIKRMTMRVQEMHGDDMVFEVEDLLMTGDEIEVLARAFSGMSEKMRGYVREIVKITTEKQRLDTELSVASDIQADMLPSQFPAFPNRPEFDLYAVMDPAKEVGGDFYDFFLVDDDHLALVMADVSGKGVPAALFMVISKTLIKNITLSGQYTTPGDILYDVNNRLFEGNKEGMFVTAWLGILTISTGEIISARAGHEYPVFYRNGKGFELGKDPAGLPLATLEDETYENARWQIAPGDLLFLYTDGLPEASDAERTLFGTDRMLEALESCWENPPDASDTIVNCDDLKAFLKRVRGRVDTFVGDAPQFDDLTMLCLRYK